ncbi:unnamed protein product, partial [Prorocentrum cordatum]
RDERGREWRKGGPPPGPAQENELDVSFSTDADSALSAITYLQARGDGSEVAVARPLWRPLFAWDDTLAFEDSATVADGEECHDPPLEDADEGALRELLWLAPGGAGSEHDGMLTSVLRDALRPPSLGRASNSGASAVEVASPGVSSSGRGARQRCGRGSPALAAARRASGAAASEASASQRCCSRRGARPRRQRRAARAALRRPCAASATAAAAAARARRSWTSRRGRPGARGPSACRARLGAGRRGRFSTARESDRSPE